MLNSYEIAKDMLKHTHILSPYKLIDVYYLPYKQIYCFAIEDKHNTTNIYSIPCEAIDEMIEKDGKQEAYRQNEMAINSILEDIKLDELVEYFYKQNLSMKKINKYIMTRELSI